MKNYRHTDQFHNRFAAHDIKPAKRFKKQVGNPLYCITCGYPIEEVNGGS